MNCIVIYFFESIEEKTYRSIFCHSDFIVEYRVGNKIRRKSYCVLFRCIFVFSQIDIFLCQL